MKIRLIVVRHYLFKLMTSCFVVLLNNHENVYCVVWECRRALLKSLLWYFVDCVLISNDRANEDIATLFMITICLLYLSFFWPYACTGFSRLMCAENRSQYDYSIMKCSLMNHMNYSVLNFLIYSVTNWIQLFFTIQLFFYYCYATATTTATTTTISIPLRPPAITD